MIKKIVLMSLFLYLLALFEKSFFVHFLNFIPSLVLIMIFLINFFERRESVFGVVIALIGGFILDLLSITFFGYYIIFSLLLAFSIKIVLKSYIEVNL